MSEKHIDYIGFTFNGVHSSTLGIVRTSDGSRFNENLLPTIQDKTVQVPGGDGTYLFGSYYTQKPFNISYAFDSLTEEQLQEIKRVFGDKKIHELIFDESPYKAYRAKVTGSATLKYIPFDEGKNNRIYKGEGSVQFTAYDPYAYSVKKYLNEYSDANINEWKDAADLLLSQDNYDKIDGNQIRLYNPGVKETDFILTLDFINGNIPSGEISILVDKSTKGQIHLDSISSINGDDQIKINTKLNLIEGYKNGIKSGNVYNKAINGGTFFKIPVSKDMQMQMTSQQAKSFKAIEYKYIYF